MGGEKEKRYGLWETTASEVARQNVAMYLANPTGRDTVLSVAGRTKLKGILQEDTPYFKKHKTYDQSGHCHLCQSAPHLDHLDCRVRARNAQNHARSRSHKGT